MAEVEYGTPRVVRDNLGNYFLVTFNSTGGGTRQRIPTGGLDAAVRLYGEPVSSFDQLPPAQRWFQIAKFGQSANKSILLDATLGFNRGGELDIEAAEDAREASDVNARGALSVVRETLDRYGLGSMAEWAWGQVQNGREFPEIMLELRTQPAFKQRFRAIEIRQANGLNAVSPETIIEYENRARDLMRSSGLPRGFYDDADDFADLIGKGVSLESVARRVEQSWDRVVNAPSEVRAAFADMYGVQGDQALAAFMFDPDKAETKLEEMARSAVAGGAMRAFGFDLDPIAAGRIAGFDFDDQTVRGGFARLARLKAVFDESVGEMGGPDLDPMREGVSSVFEMGAGEEAIRQRVERRLAEFSGSGGVAATDQGLLAGEAN